jgi:hypothetical protein
MARACLAEETQRSFAVPFGRQQKIHRSASLIDRSLQVFPLPLNPHLDLAQPPTIAHRSLVSGEYLL